jgi:hypothetical protein
MTSCVARGHEYGVARGNEMMVANKADLLTLDYGQEI